MVKYSATVIAIPMKPTLFPSVAVWMFFRTAYLFVYNIAQGLAFFYIAASILVMLIFKGKGT